MYVEITSNDGQVYEFNGVAEANYISNEDSRSESFVRLNYIIPRNPVEREKFDAETGEPEYEDVSYDNVTLNRFPEEGVKKLTINNATITGVKPDDIGDAFSD